MSTTIVFIIYVLAFQGILTGLILLAKRNIRNSDSLYAVLFLLVFSLFLLGKNLYWSSFYLSYPHFIFTVVAFPLLFGPLLYLSMDSRRKSYRIILHFVPFLLLLIHHIPFYVASAEFKLEFLRTVIFTGKINAKFFIYRTITVLQIVLYVYLLSKAIGKNISSRKYHWHKKINLLYAAFGLVYLLQMAVYGWFNHLDFIGIYFAVFMTMMAAFILFFVTKVILVPELFRSGSRYVRSGLSRNKMEQYSKLVLSAMDEERLFLKKDLRLVDLAHQVDLTEHQLSQVLSEHFEMNFFEFINSYRINYAKELVLDTKFRNYTIDAIAQEVCFKSKSTFYGAFKKFVGTTPSAFKKDHQY